MFTGLIQGKGKIVKITRQGKEARFNIRPLWDMRGFTDGESIAVNGACLTVDGFDASAFNAYASGETLKHTNLGELAAGSEVNLERALRMGDSLGGHIVSGHVDAVCTVERVTPAGDSKIYRLSCPVDSPGQMRYIVPKGSVALDGISLTVNATGPDWFEVNIIPSTQGATTIAAWLPGRRINLETDIIGKYVERMLQPFTGAPQAAAGASSSGSGLDLDFFRKNGF